MQTKRRAGEKDPHDLDVLKEELKASVAEALERFKGIDTSDTGFQALSEAQERMPDQGTRDDFARDFLKVQALFELIWPDEEIRPIRESYRWLAKIYQSIQPAMTSDALLWQRLGAKTLELVNQHVVDVDVRGAGVERVTIDEETLKALRELGIEPAEEGEEKKRPEPPDAEQIIDSIEERIKQRLAGEKESKKYKSLAERLDKLRQAQLSEAADSIEFLKQLLAVARDVVAADRELGADKGETGAVDPGEQASLLPEERIGALTQIFREYRPDDAPEIIERVVKEIDSVVMGSRFSRWQESREGTRLVKTEIRKALQKFGLPATGELFDRAYAYVAENY
jgi:type I restriction enzyme R subunit